MSTAHGVRDARSSPRARSSSTGRTRRSTTCTGRCSPRATAPRTRATARSRSRRARSDAGVRFVVRRDRHGLPPRPGGRIAGVRTDRGDVEAEAVVLAGGLWSSELARLAGESVPLYPAEHVWVETEADPRARRSGPRSCATSTATSTSGPYRDGVRGRRVRAARQAEAPGRHHDRRVRGVRRGLGPLRARARERPRAAAGPARDRVPPLPARARVASRPTRTCTSGTFPETPGLWVAAGLNSQGMIYGPGVGGRARRVDRRGPPDVRPDRARPDARRALVEQPRVAARQDRRDARAALRDALARPAVRGGPRRPARAAARPAARRGRGLRRGRRVGARGVVLAGGDRAARVGVTTSTGRRGSATSRDEVRACREAAALFDLSTYAKFQVEGPAALEGLQRLRRERPRRRARSGRLHACSRTSAAGSRWTRP